MNLTSKHFISQLVKEGIEIKKLREKWFKGMGSRKKDGIFVINNLK